MDLFENRILTSLISNVKDIFWAQYQTLHLALGMLIPDFSQQRVPWHNQFWTDFAVAYGLDLLLNTDFFTFYRECQRPVASQLHGQTKRDNKVQNFRSQNLRMYVQLKFSWFYLPFSFVFYFCNGSYSWFIYFNH